MRIQILRSFRRFCLLNLLLCFLGSVWAQSQPSSRVNEFPPGTKVLTPDVLSERLSGNTFSTQYAIGIQGVFKYHANKDFQISLSSGLTDKGTWHIEGEKICYKFEGKIPSGCSEHRANDSHIFLRRYTTPEVLRLDITAPGEPKSVDTSSHLLLYKVQTGRTDVTMNILVVPPEKAVNKILLVVPGTPGSEGRIMIRSEMDANWAFQYLFAHAPLFYEAGIMLVAMGCPTDQWERFGQCYDDYRSSSQYADDVSKVIEFLKKKYSAQSFHVFGHSSGGISTRWLALNLKDKLNGIVNSSAMNGSAGNLARSMYRFDMADIKIPVLNIAHEDDECPSTPYYVVKRYSKNNLITVRGGGQSGSICGGANRHSFEGRQRGVSRAIIRWVTAGVVQAYVDSDD